MKHYIDLLMGNTIFILIMLLLILFLLGCLYVKLKDYFIDMLVIDLLLFIVYLPFGVFMAIYDWLTYVEWWHEPNKNFWIKENIFVDVFIYVLVFNILLIACRYLTNISISRYDTKLKNLRKSFFSYQYEPEYLLGKLDVLIGITFYIDIFGILFTLIFLVKLIIKFIA
jgi:hypothetical protein